MRSSGNSSVEIYPPAAMCRVDLFYSRWFRKETAASHLPLRRRQRLRGNLLNHGSFLETQTEVLANVDCPNSACAVQRAQGVGMGSSRCVQSVDGLLSFEDGGLKYRLHPKEPTDGYRPVKLQDIQNPNEPHWVPSIFEGVVKSTRQCERAEEINRMIEWTSWKWG
jgi:hypothetical protein